MMERGKGRVISRTKGFYYIVTEQNQPVECKVKGQLFKDSKFDNQIAVGDIVRYTVRKSDGVGLIDGIESRTSFLARSRVGKEADQVLAANIDYLLILAATKQPSFRLNLINRILVAAAVGKVKPVLIITKTDLVGRDEAQNIITPYLKTEIPIFFSSIKDERLNNDLYEILANNITLLAGQSGVGKSSLLNRYFPDLDLKVGMVSRKTSKGLHTTTYARMFQISDHGHVIDTPGVREFGLRQVNRSNLGQYYPLFDKYASDCKHRDCVHIHEPECAVKQAVRDNQIHNALYDGYISIYESLKN